MHSWRICRRRYAADAATGEGAPCMAVAGTRVRVVYGSTSLTLAAVETFVNLEPNLQTRDLISIEREISEET